MQEINNKQFDHALTTHYLSKITAPSKQLHQYNPINDRSFLVHK